MAGLEETLSRSVRGVWQFWFIDNEISSGKCGIIYHDLGQSSEVGGREEYLVCEAIKKGVITKPLVAWCIGTCADMFATDVQFGHAGASAGAAEETATAKNAALGGAGAVVPASFDELGDKIREVYTKLVKAGTIVPKAEVPPPPSQWTTTGRGSEGSSGNPRARPGAALHRDPHLGGVQAGHGHRRRALAALVLAEAAALSLQVPGDVSDDHGGPRARGVRRAQHNRIVCAREGAGRGCAGRGGAAQRPLRPSRRQVHGQEQQLRHRRKVDENYSQNPYQLFIFLSAKNKEDEKAWNK